MLQTRCVHIWQQQQTGAPRHSQQQHHSSACAQPPCHAPQSCSLTNYVYLTQGDPLSAAQFLELGALCVAHHTTKESQGCLLLLLLLAAVAVQPLLLLLLLSAPLLTPLLFPLQPAAFSMQQRTHKCLPGQSASTQCNARWAPIATIPHHSLCIRMRHSARGVVVVDIPMHNVCHPDSVPVLHRSACACRFRTE